MSGTLLASYVLSCLGALLILLIVLILLARDEHQEDARYQSWLASLPYDPDTPDPDLIVRRT